METLLHFLTAPLHLLTVIACAGSLWMLYEYLRKRKHRLAAVCAGAGSGLAVLLLIRMHGGILGFDLPLSLPYLGIAAIGGIPGVLLMLLLDRLRV